MTHVKHVIIIMGQTALVSQKEVLDVVKVRYETSSIIKNRTE